MNAEMLREAARMPIDMTFWLQRKDCGTVGCLGGNIAIICGATPVWPPASGYEPNRTARCIPKNKLKSAVVMDFAREQAALPNDRIFLVGLWPKELMEKLGVELDGNPSQEQVQAAVEDYIETGGWGPNPWECWEQL